MAYEYNQDAYYGDDTPMIGPYAPGMSQWAWDAVRGEWVLKPGSTPTPTPTPGPDPTPTPTPIDPSEITELDFSKISVVNAPWLEKTPLDQLLQQVSSDPKTLNQTIESLKELISTLKDVATAAQA